MSQTKPRDAMQSIVFFLHCRSLLLLLVISTINAGAASAPYGKDASTRVKKIISSPSYHDGDVLDLDYEISMIYRYALLSTDNPKRLKKNQSKWLKERDQCQDTLCIIDKNKHRVQYLESIINGKSDKTTNSVNEALKGLWYGADRAAYAIFGTILITDNVIVYGLGNNKDQYCKASYTIEKDQYGLTFKNQIGYVYELNKNSTFTTYKLKLKPHACLGNLAYLRFTLPFRNMMLADVIEYYNNSMVFGYIHFQKIQK